MGLPSRDARRWAEVKGLFRRKFGLGLEELVVLFENPHWKHSARGGNQRANITRATVELCRPLDSGNTNEASVLVPRIRGMQHNTGFVGNKLRHLDESLQFC